MAQLYTRYTPKPGVVQYQTWPTLQSCLDGWWWMHMGTCSSGLALPCRGCRESGSSCRRHRSCLTCWRHLQLGGGGSWISPWLQPNFILRSWATQVRFRLGSYLAKISNNQMSFWEAHFQDGMLQCCWFFHFFWVKSFIIIHHPGRASAAEVASIPSIPEASIPEADIPPMDSNYSAKSVPIQAAWTWRLVAGDKSGNIWS